MRALTESQLNRVRYIRTLLEWHGLNHQATLAGVLGCTQQTASNKLTGKRKFSAEDLEAIAEATGIDPGHLLRPPPLDEVFGPPARTPLAHLLTCTFKQFPQVRAGVCPPGGRTGKSGVFPQMRAA